ncbi:MAG: VWA domain-containing protein, partial [Anaerolineae bacterium]|nr:VWA domain-containing protein [Anaerolineae bacterium]
MKKYLLLLLVGLLLLPVLRAVMQGETYDLDITGVNASQIPTITLTTSVVDASGQPVAGLDIPNFTLSGGLAERARIVQVENITEDDLSFAAVLVIDTSSSVAGEPFRQIQEAARLFINSVGANDPIAILTFASDVTLVQDYTTDKAALLNTIDTLSFGGETALYDAAVAGVQQAAAAPSPRRAVILLSDGAEFGGESTQARADGLAAAQAAGVPVYSIGLGFGTDRTYLEEIAAGSNARFYEAPAPAELSGIYSALAQLFRSQYVLTLAFAPYDPLLDGGTVYDLALQAAAGEAVSNTSNGIVRIPASVPIVTLPADVLAAPLREPVTITPQIVADDGVARVEFLAAGSTSAGDSLTLDPVQFAPGTYPLSVIVTDNNGDVGLLETRFEVAALPPEITLNWQPGSAPLTERQTLSITAAGQTPVVNTLFSIHLPDGTPALAALDETSDFDFVFDPFDLPPGDYVLRVEATSAADTTATLEQP